MTVGGVLDLLAARIIYFSKETCNRSYTGRRTARVSGGPAVFYSVLIAWLNTVLQVEYRVSQL